MEEVLGHPAGAGEAPVLSRLDDSEGRGGSGAPAVGKQPGQCSLEQSDGERKPGGGTADRSVAVGEVRVARPDRLQGKVPVSPRSLAQCCPALLGSHLQSLERRQFGSKRRGPGGSHSLPFPRMDDWGRPHTISLRSSHTLPLGASRLQEGLGRPLSG